MIENMPQYRQQLLDHFQNKRNYGDVEQPTFASGQYDPSCGDRISITGIVQNGIIVDIKFTGSGCVISQATASMLTEAVKGKLVEQVRAMTIDDVIGIIGIQLGPNRLRCAQLPLLAIKQSLEP